jgi:hypothetical protein
MNDILTAESLIFTVIGIFFGLWYTEIDQSADYSLYKYYIRIKAIPKIRFELPNPRVLHGSLVKVFILGLLPNCVFLIFLPDVIKAHYISDQTLRIYGMEKFFEYFSSVNTAFVFVWIILGFMFLYCSYLSIRIYLNIAGIHYLSECWDKSETK